MIFIIKAAETGTMDHVRILMMGTDFHIDSYGRNGKGHLGYTALLSSVQHGNYEMVYFLLQNGANPKLRLTGEIHSDANALHMANHQKHLRLQINNLEKKLDIMLKEQVSAKQQMEKQMAMIEKLFQRLND